MAVLKKVDQNRLKDASRSGVALRFTGLQRYFAARRWLGGNNRYLHDCVRKLSDEVRSGMPVNSDHLAQYIAASAILHCSDGWSYLGRALDCQNRGDRHAALHLAYYAELRAAMSLLATEGIAIFNDNHFVVDQTGRCKKLNSRARTHKITWPILEYWADRPESANLLLDIIKPLGIPLRQWIDSFGGPSSFGHIGRDWLLQWGLDLRLLADDHISRNQASYRPTCITILSPPNTLRCSEFLENIWAVCEPSGTSRFSLLDNHLLRIGLQQIFKSTLDKTIQQASSQYEKKIDNMIGTLLQVSGFSTQFKEFLMWQIDPGMPLIISEARKLNTDNDSSNHLHVISRALLLLRGATGACERLIAQGMATRANLAFWWGPFGEGVGLWDSGNSPIYFYDLWSDIDQALSDVRNWQKSNAGASPSYNKWGADLSRTISILGSCERIVLWGLGI